MTTTNYVFEIKPRYDKTYIPFTKWILATSLEEALAGLEKRLTIAPKIDGAPLHSVDDYEFKFRI